MENKENLSIQSFRKPVTPQATRKTVTNNNSLLQNQMANECLKKEDTTTSKVAVTKEYLSMEPLPRTEEFNETNKKENTSEGASAQRPSTVSGGFRKKAESRDRKDRSPGIPTSKSFSTQSKNNSFDRRSIGSTRSESPSAHVKVKKQTLSKSKAKSPVKNVYRIEYAEDFESTSLFPQAVYEQSQIIEMLSAARDELREKMVEKMMSKGATKLDFKGDFTEYASSAPPNSANFENSYSGILEEIFQAWVNLFYFIINLKVNLIRVLNCAGTEPFRPNSETEREIVGQAIECVKFFSKLKIKSIVNVLEEFSLPDDHIKNEIHIKDYEERVSSPILFEMDFIQKKAKEILEQMKNEKNFHYPNDTIKEKT